MNLRVIAVAAPDSLAGAKEVSALNSADPASLFNACRLAAYAAQHSNDSWSRSNWNCSRAELRQKFMLLYSLDDLTHYKALLERERPNIVFIGAMTLCFPGAVECARIAKETLGENVLVILGGRHPSETMYLEMKALRKPSSVRHHLSSPLQLIRRGKIPPVFDFVVSGDGEHLIRAIGNAYGEMMETGDNGLVDLMAKIEPCTPGDWILGCVTEDKVHYVISQAEPIDYSFLPSIAKMFGVSAAFDVFEGRLTAHVFSDTGSGCVYDCMFCSERSSVTGGLKALETAAQRLYRQLKEAYEVISENNSRRGASAFVEDSVLLGGSPKLIERFVTLLEEQPIDIVFGAQFTIDQIISRRPLIERLAKVGLRYVFIGVETFEPDEIGGMSKDLGRKRASWYARFQEVLTILDLAQVKCGCAVLFGLGENHASRLRLLEALHFHRVRQGNPVVVSANWAVQHPLRGQDGGANYEYLDWGTPKGELLDCFHKFGEASLRYPLVGVEPPSLKEVQEVIALLDTLADVKTLDARVA